MYIFRRPAAILYTWLHVNPIPPGGIHKALPNIYIPLSGATVSTHNEERERALRQFLQVNSDRPGGVPIYILKEVYSDRPGGVRAA